MQSHPLNKARADLSNIIDKALAGEPQRITRHGKQAVIVVSEDEWRKRPQAASSLGALIADWAEQGLLGPDMVDRPWPERELGRDVE